ncbi:hypothetical protein JYT28_00915 [Desulfobulbus sp. AH-315-M07]|nr:hypothetical protein [Desulfobulbus sp. AH-315-M07]
MRLIVVLALALVGCEGAAGPPGFQGPEGQKGEPGDPGAVGDPGAEGGQGGQGDPGAAGTPDAVFVTITLNFDGARGGYGGAQLLCDMVNAGSHVCTAGEMSRSAQLGLLPSSGLLWFAQGVRSNTEDVPPQIIDDCAGFTSNIATRHGAVWDATLGHPVLLTGCSTPRSFACCKSP